MSEQAGKIAGAMAAIMGEIGGVAKTRNNAQQGYKFRGIADITLAAQPLMAKHGVVLVPHEVQDVKEYERATKSGSLMHHIRARILWRFYHQDGSFITAVTTGEAMDTGDKTWNKVMSAAQKYVLVQAFCIPEDDPAQDTEHSDPEESPAKKAQPAQKAQPARSLPLSEDEQHKLANWELGLETKHSPEDIARARKNASVLTSAALKAAVMDAIERYAKKAAA